jgi:hypothetical protein
MVISLDYTFNSRQITDTYWLAKSGTGTRASLKANGQVATHYIEVQFDLCVPIKPV